jgi:hypothetical protein
VDVAEESRQFAGYKILVLLEESPRRAALINEAFVEKMDQEGAVCNHLRHPERRPRSLSNPRSLAGFALGGGSAS